MRRHSVAKVPQQVVSVAQVAVRSTLGGPITKLLHEHQVCPESARGDD